jgi:hypothetical protein
VAVCCTAARTSGGCSGCTGRRIRSCAGAEAGHGGCEGEVETCGVCRQIARMASDRLPLLFGCAQGFTRVAQCGGKRSWHWLDAELPAADGLLTPQLWEVATLCSIHGPWREGSAKLRVVLGMSATYLLLFHSTLSSESSYSVLNRRKRLAARSVIAARCVTVRISE